MASVFPASAALPYQRCARRPGPAAPAGRQQDAEVDHGVGVAGVGGPPVPGRARRPGPAAPAGRQQDPEVDHRVGVAGVGGLLGTRSARAVQVRRLQLVSQQDPEVDHGVGVAGSAAFSYQVRAPSRSGGSSSVPAGCPRLTMALVFPRSAALGTSPGAAARSCGIASLASNQPRFRIEWSFPSSAAMVSACTATSVFPL